MKKRGLPYQLVMGDSHSKWDVVANGLYPEWKDDAKHFDEFAAFLDKNL
jgi:hypothetical protein